MLKSKSTKNGRALETSKTLKPPLQLCRKKKFQQFCLGHQNVLNFSVLGPFFSLDEAEKRVGGKERGLGAEV